MDKKKSRLTERQIERQIDKHTNRMTYEEKAERVLELPMVRTIDKGTGR